ncbi:MAG: S24 family peptidase [Pseudomonadota bacterium]
MTESVADRIRKSRINAGYETAQEAADAFGWKYATYVGHENGQRGARADSLQRYARAFRVPVEWLLTGKRGGSHALVSPNGVTEVPIFDIRASAGAGALVEDGEPTGYQPYREAEVARWNADDLAVIQVGGDSMWETLHDGDKVLVNRGERRIVKPGIYILAYESELLVKRCQRDLNDGSVIVSSDNPAYDTFKVTQADKLDVLGRVVWIGRALG